MTEEIRDEWLARLAEVVSVLTHSNLVIERNDNEADDALAKEHHRQRAIEETNRTLSESHLNDMLKKANPATPPKINTKHDSDHKEYPAVLTPTHSNARKQSHLLLVLLHFLVL